MISQMLDHKPGLQYRASGSRRERTTNLYYGELVNASLRCAYETLRGPRMRRTGARVTSIGTDVADHVWLVSVLLDMAASAAAAAAVDVVMAGAWAIARTIDLPEYRQVREQTRKGLEVIAATPTSMRHRFSTAFDVGSSSPATPAEPRSVAV